MKFTSDLVGLFIIHKLLLSLIISDVVGHVTISSNSTGYLKETFYCGITDKILSLDCSITVESQNTRSSLGGCYEYQKDSLTIVLDQSTLLQSFECISKNPFTINFDFGSEKQRLQFTKFTRERISPDFFNSSSYFFKIKMVVPRNQRYEIEYEQTSSFTYTLLSLNQLMANQAMKIRFFMQSQQAYSSRVRNSPVEYNYLADTSSITTIDVTGDIIYVPCIPPFKVLLFFLEGIENNGNCPDSPSKIKLSNSSMSQWNSVEGFRVNVSSIWNRDGTLVCVGEHVEQNHSQWAHGKTCNSFGLKFPPSLQIYPKTDIIKYKYLEKFKTSLWMPPNVHLICSSTDKNVTMDLRYSYKNEIKFIPNHKEVSEPQHRFTTEIELSYLVLKSLKEIRDRWDRMSLDFFVDCVESSNKTKKLHTWIFSKNTQSSLLTYEPSLERFVCNGSSVNHVPLLQIECDDIYECRTWEKSLQNKKTRECSSDQFVPFLKGEACDGHPYKVGDFCISASPIRKAFLQCSTPGHEPSNELYFKGFDSKIYTRSDVPPEAVLQLQCFNSQENYVIVGQTVTCSCEGHSFFHAHGIQWMVVFTNDSIKTLPKEMISYKEPPRSKDQYNPLSIVDIKFKFKNIKSIICAVPLLNTKDWQNAAENVQVLDGIAPKIFYFELKKEIAVGEKGQSLSCASEGRPTPKVEWSYNGGPIEPPLLVVNQGISKLLIFPDYDDKLKGEYTCNASNKYGNDIKYFTVSTKMESIFGISSIIILTTSICLLIAMLPCLYLIRRLRNSQRLVAALTDSELDEFFKGMENLQFTESVSSPSALPYDTKYELAKGSFEIDKKQILGSGEFGTVYKGTIDSQDGEFAFKTTKHFCSPEILKGMLSELKIMIYVGSHENIIKLVGAYTQDIQSGILYIATELCSFGSLRTNLQNMKQDISEGFNFQNSKLFLKCLRWLEEIAHGMEFLSIKHVIHSDLATRNILLAEGEVAKIADFGLSRRMYNYCDYKKTDKTNPLPWKWCAIESLRDMTFSTQSDVWAYGITMWEIFSLGSAPYPGISWTIEFVDMLDQGLRNLKPKYATTALYNIMLSCWSKNPTDRPEFGDLRYFFMEYSEEDLDGDAQSPDSQNREDLYIGLNL